MAKQNEPNFLTREEAAEYLGIKPNTLASWAHGKRFGLPFFKVGGAVRYRQVDLDAWLNSRIVGPLADRG